MTRAQGSLSVLTYILVLSAKNAVGCIHDQLPHRITTGKQDYSISVPLTALEEESRHRRLAPQINIVGHQTYDRTVGMLVDSSSYHPIRITPYYDNSSLDTLSSVNRDVIFRVIPTAIAYFEQTLQIIPVKGNLSAQHSCYYAWDTVPKVCNTFVEDETCFEMVIPEEHFGATRICSTCLSTGCTKGSCTYSPGQGIPDSDYLLYVRSEDTSYCTGQVLAYASACQKDQFDRPTFGMVNFCPDKISADDSDYKDQVSTALHELTHALGFSADFFPYMRKSDGTPRTPRDANGEPPTKTSGMCANGNSISYFVQPASTTVEYTTEREHSVAKLITPKVAAFVQQHFNCSSLTGAELESNDPGCIGSHWEERLFEPEYMSPVLSFRNILSGLTLAFFEDSGWYKTNASNAQRLVFGENRGCEFARNKCIDPSTLIPVATDHYCTANTAESCSVDATSRSVCTIESGLSIPSIYQYFPSKPTLGSSNAFADYCPMNIGYKYGDCTVAGNLATPPGTTINILGETYCPTCKCASTSLRSSDSTDWAVNPRRITGCYAMECIWNGKKVTAITVRIPRSSSSDFVSINCSTKGEALSVPGFSGVFTCPDPFVVCGTTPSYSESMQWLGTDAVTPTPTSSTTSTPSPSPSIRSADTKTNDAGDSIQLPPGVWVLGVGIVLAWAEM